MQRPMKQSGGDWIKHLPVGWDIRRLKDFCIKRGTGGTPLGAGESAFSDSDDAPRWIKPSNISVGKLRGTMLRLSKLGTSDVATVRGDCLFVNGIGDVGKSAPFSGWASCNQQINYFKINKDIFLSWIGYRAEALEWIWKSYSVSTTLPICNRTKMESISLSVPPLTEQVAIASYLDEVTAAIDEQKALLAKKKELLQEQKKALIHKAVTKGLDDSVAMKPSGVAWIGDVPVGWEVRRIKDFYSLFRGSGLSKSMLDLSGSACILYGQLFTKFGMKIEDIDTFTSSGNGFNGRSGDVLMPATTTTTSRDLARASHLKVDSKIGGDIHILRPRGGMDNDYLCMLASSLGNEFASNGSAVTVAHSSKDFVSSICIPFPPIREQIAIANFLGEATAATNEQCELIEKKIALLTEMRASVIHDAVTKGIPAAQ